MRSFIIGIIHQILIKESGMIGHVARIGRILTAYKILIRKREVKRALWKYRRRREDDIKTDIKEIRGSVVG
jgi:uncharacterized protein YihD (DUF1040 family)